MELTREEKSIAGLEVVTHAWKEWGLQVLVLLSFTLQLTLLVLADFRRRTDSGVLKFFVWSVYLLTDAMAIYVLGHMSLTNRSPEHELIALWAPFLLLHLGGQHNIIAYSIQDTKLWLRHLQTLVVQVTAAAYVLYESPINSLLRLASILIFVIGVAKYGERVWALCCVDITPSIKNYRPAKSSVRTDASHVPSIRHRDQEALLMIAHLLMDIPKGFLRELPSIHIYYSSASSLLGEEMWKVVEMQVSLLHDVFYTKAEVMHTWYGLCIGIISPLVIAVTFSLVIILLDDSHNKKSYNRVDVGITYALFVGALFLELISLLRAMFSSRTSVILLKWSFNDKGEEKRNVWHFLGGVVAHVRRLVRAAEWRMLCSLSMGQHNMLQLCARSRASKISKIAKWMRVEDRWDMLVSSWSIPVGASVKHLFMKQMSKNPNSNELLRSGGRQALVSRGLYDQMYWSVSGSNKVDAILTWHIGTDIYLCWYKKEQAKAGAQLQSSLVEPIEAISNYLLFLLASRTSMVSKSREHYVRMCYYLTGLKFSSAEDLGMMLWRYGDAWNSAGSEFRRSLINFPEDRRDSLRKDPQLANGARLGAILISKDQLVDSTTGEMLELVAEVWAEMLFYVAGECDSNYHAEQLSHGGELVTIARFLVLYLSNGMVSERFSGPSEQ